MRLACLGALATLGLAALLWRSLVTRYHLHRLRADPEAFEAMIAAPRSQEAERALEEFAGTKEGTVRIAGWMLHYATSDDGGTLRDVEQADCAFLALWQATVPKDPAAAGWGTVVGSMNRTVEEREPALSVTRRYRHRKRFDGHAAHWAIWSLLPHADRNEFALAELPGLRAHILPRDEALPLAEGLTLDDTSVEDGVFVSPCVVFLRRGP